MELEEIYKSVQKEPLRIAQGLGARGNTIGEAIGQGCRQGVTSSQTVSFDEDVRRIHAVKCG